MIKKNVKSMMILSKKLRKDREIIEYIFLKKDPLYV